jgi:hypothetical protein
MALAGSTLALGTEREMFDRAEKVVLVKVVHLGEPEDAPGSTRARPYHYQRWWVQDATVYKGPPAPARLGYETVLAPVGRHHRSPSAAFPRRMTVTEIPPDAEVLLYLVRDVAGAWTLLDGRDGFYRYPGPTRKANLKTWSKTAGKPARPPRKR